MQRFNSNHGSLPTNMARLGSTTRFYFGSWKLTVYIALRFFHLSLMLRPGVFRTPFTLIKKGSLFGSLARFVNIRQSYSIPVPLIASHQLHDG
jgi:hypothetical protein